MHADQDVGIHRERGLKVVDFLGRVGLCVGNAENFNVQVLEDCLACGQLALVDLIVQLMIADCDGVAARANLFLLFFGEHYVFEAAGNRSVGANVAKQGGVVVVDLLILR